MPHPRWDGGDGECTISLGSLFQIPHHSFWKEVFLNIQPGPPQRSLRPLPSATTSSSERSIRQWYEQFGRAVWQAVLLSPEDQKLCTQHWQPMIRTETSVIAKENFQLDDLLTCWKSHAHSSNSCLLIMSRGWVAGNLSYVWTARLSAKAEQWWWNGYFRYCKENLIFQLTTKYTIQHSGKFEKLLKF